MKPIFGAAAALLAVSAAHAASVLNSDAEPRTLIVTEDERRTEILLAPGQAAQFCPRGCFVIMPDRAFEVLTGAEFIEIRDGQAHFR